MGTPRLIERLVSFRRPLLALACLLAFLSWYGLPQLKYDRSIENMFPADSAVLSEYSKLKRTFGGNEIVLAVYRDPQLFAKSGEGIDRVRVVQRRLAALPGVKAVLSIDQPLPGNSIVAETTLAARTRKLFTGYTHGDDQETVSIVCMLYPPGQRPSPADDSNDVLATQATAEVDDASSDNSNGDGATDLRRETIDQMREIMHSLPDGLEPGFLTGEPILVVDGFRFVEQDGRRLGIWSTVLLGCTIIACFRSLRWVLIPVVVVQLSLLLTQASLGVAQVRLSMVSSMLTAVVMVIGVATMVHIMVRYAESRGLGLSPHDSIVRTLQQLVVPITWACLTDAVGFLSLTVSEVGPVFDFGVMMAVGSIMVWVSVLLVTPGLTLAGKVDMDPQTPWGEGHLVGQLESVLGSVQRNTFRYFVGLACIIAIAILGIGRLRVETDFTRNFRANSDIAKAYRYVEDHLGGAGVCDVVVPADDRLTWPYLESVFELGQQLRELPETTGQFSPITKSFSLSDALVELSPVDLRTQSRFVQGGVTLGLTTMRGWMPEFYDALYHEDPADGQHYMRLMLRVEERQGVDQKRELLRQVKATSQRQFPEAEVTGYFVLLSHLIDSVLRDQWRSFLAAIIGIGLLMTIAFRDLRLAAIALVPNALPVLVVLGGMGWLSVSLWPDLKINMGTAMIAAVSMGLSIDSSIHYIIGFKRALREGIGFEQALLRVQCRVGKALVLSTLALSVGFTVLATSEFVPTVYFGVLVTLAMLGGLAGNLIGLPLLLLLFYRRDRVAISHEN